MQKSSQSNKISKRCKDVTQVSTRPEKEVRRCKDVVKVSNADRSYVIKTQVSTRPKKGSAKILSIKQNQQIEHVK